MTPAQCRNRLIGRVIMPTLAALVEGLAGPCRLTGVQRGQTRSRPRCLVHLNRNLAIGLR